MVMELFGRILFSCLRRIPGGLEIPFFLWSLDLSLRDILEVSRQQIGDGYGAFRAYPVLVPQEDPRAVAVGSGDSFLPLEPGPEPEGYPGVLPRAAEAREASRGRKYSFFPRHRGVAGGRSADAADPKDVQKHRVVVTATVLGFLLAAALLCCTVALVLRKRKQHHRAAPGSGPGTSGHPWHPDTQPTHPGALENWTQHQRPPVPPGKPAHQPPLQSLQPPSSAPVPGHQQPWCHQQPMAAPHMQPQAKQQLPLAAPVAVRLPPKPPPLPPGRATCVFCLSRRDQLPPDGMGRDM
ncbi:uncharacterized protein [Struthio camelus]|uniref:uncharacterized protein n=1 Tax=Struthio camelus TaxID=8801 RepID=UPI003603BD05